MQTKTCQNCKKEFNIEPEDFSFYEKIGVLPPKMCHLCRAQHRLLFRNERSFYKRNCDKCKKSVVSMHSPNKPYTVWCYDCWFSDDWDANEYALEYDNSKSFLEQYEQLLNAVPKIGLIYINSPGSEYTNISADNKNCYMIIESSNNENSIHSYWIQECRDVVDTSFASKCELTYECDDCYNSYQIFYSKGCHDCRDSYFLLDCKGCSNCVGCVNLRQSQYCIFNEQYSKSDYEEKLKEMKLDTHDGVENLRNKFNEFVLTQPRKYAEILNVTNSTGNYIKNAKNCTSCFHCYEAENNKYGVHVWRNAKDNMDCDTAGRNATLVYNSINAGLDVSNQICCAVCWSSTFTQYSMYCFNSNNIFGSYGLRKKNFCILNKQYTKEEYEKLKNEIIEQMKKEGTYGEFFPASFSCFGYNESAAEVQFSMTHGDAQAKGYKWEETPRGTYNKQTKAWKDIPDSLENADFNPTAEIFECTHCKKNYRVIANEVLFYKKLSIPLPRMCPECRDTRRFIARGPNRIWHRSCMCTKNNHGHEGVCQNEFETAYSPDKQEIIYCESCYQKEVM